MTERTLRRQVRMHAPCAHYTGWFWFRAPIGMANFRHASLYVATFTKLRKGQLENLGTQKMYSTHISALLDLISTLRGT